MVLYFTSSATEPPCVIYMGKDKYENEELIKHGWDEDFHVDKLSSAHVYLRIPDGSGYTWDTLPTDLLVDCAQLVKANSIEGNKLNNIQVIYTPWSNLKKTGDMAIGQVSFHNPKTVRRIMIKKRTNEIVNRMNKTQQELYPDLGEERRNHDKLKQRAERNKLVEQRQEEERLREEARQAKEQQSYSSIFEGGDMVTNAQRYTSVEEAEDDFM